MADPRPVRIVRSAAPRSTRSADPEEATRRYWDSEAGGTEAYEANRAGTSRALRVFALFGVGLVVILSLFAGLAATSPDPGISDSATVYGLLALTTVVLAGLGLVITILRAPQGAAFGSDGVLVTDRLGRRRRWPVGGQLKTRVLQSYPPSLFGSEPTELIELSDRDGHHAAYLVGRGFFDRAEQPVAA
jgi:hypothetical protein